MGDEHDQQGIRCSDRRQPDAHDSPSAQVAQQDRSAQRANDDSHAKRQEDDANVAVMRTDTTISDASLWQMPTGHLLALHLDCFTKEQAEWLAKALTADSSGHWKCQR
jgi:hypothetical protein